MSDENGCEVMETIDEIVREMRIIGSVEEKSTDQMLSSFQSPGLRMFADRIEAAAKREREAGSEAAQICGEIGEMVGREAACHQSVTDCHGLNAAAMREALEKTKSVIATCMEILNKIPDGCDYDGLVDEVADELCDLRDSHVKAALFAPPRNCDVGTSDEHEKRYLALCDRNKCSSCPVRFKGKTDCVFTWEQMPYEEVKT